jgi:hypothetical protein
MKELLKILFDLSFYYALSGYFFFLFTENHPSVWGLPLLMLSACLFIRFTRSSKPPEPGGGFTPGDGFSQGDGSIASRIRHSKIVLICAIISCALPGALFAFGISFWQTIQFLPAWAFLVFTLLSGRIYTTLEDFKRHFSFTGKLFLLVLIPWFFIFSMVGGALAAAIPYAILYLITGVCLMRVLRDDGKLAVRRNIVVLLALLLVSIVFAMLQAPQLILSAAWFIYQHVIARLITVMSVVLFFLMFGIGPGEIAYEEEIPIQLPNELIDSGNEMLEFTGWLVAVPIFIVLGCVVLAIFRIFRRLLGNKRFEKRVRVYTEEHERLQKPERGSKIGGILRPRDPRLAVRWYYRKYLKEGIIRGAHPSRADTSQRILKKFSPYFPAAGAERLRELYIVSRYNYVKEISKADSDNAAKAWREMKQDK